MISWVRDSSCALGVSWCFFMWEWMDDLGLVVFGCADCFTPLRVGLWGKGVSKENPNKISLNFQSQDKLSQEH